MFAHLLQLDQLKNSKCNLNIKIILGVRRSGKTTLINQYQACLKRNGVPSRQITTINFERSPLLVSQGAAELGKQIKNKLAKNKINYLFLDELDVLPNYQELIGRLVGCANIDLYITGSDSRISQLANKFPCQLIPVYPLNYHEFIDYHRQPADFTSLYHYLNRGGFPFAQGIRDDDSARNYCEDVLNTIILKGLIRHTGLANPALIKQLAVFLAQRPGVPINVSQAVAALKEENIQVSNKTLAAYLTFIQEGFLFSACPELSLKNNLVKQTNIQYYPIDPGLRCLLTNRQGALSETNLMMLVYNELIARGFRVYSGQGNRYPVTFIGIRNQEQHFFQFNYSFLNQAAYLKATDGLRHLPAGTQQTLIIAKPGDKQWGKGEQFTTTSLIDWLTA